MHCAGTEHSTVRSISPSTLIDAHLWRGEKARSQGILAGLRHEVAAQADKPHENDVGVRGKCRSVQITLVIDFNCTPRIDDTASLTVLSHSTANRATTRDRCRTRARAAT